MRRRSAPKRARTAVPTGGARISWLLQPMVPPNNRPGWDMTGRIREFAAFSDTPNGLTRVYLGTAHRQADVSMGWMQAAGVRSPLDAIGNVVGAMGETPDASTLQLGSHVDTVDNASRFDGSLEVITAIEVVRQWPCRSGDVRSPSR